MCIEKIFSALTLFVEQQEDILSVKFPVPTILNSSFVDLEYCNSEKIG